MSAADRLLVPVQAWRRFFFSEAPMTTLGLVRIAFGVMAIGWTFSLLPQLFDLFGKDGIQSKPASIQYAWGILNVFPSDTAVLIVWFALLAGSILLTVGWHSRIAALVVFVMVLSFERRNVFVFNSGDGLVRIEALFLALTPCGAALSLDRLRTAGSFWSAQVRPVWGLRLFQLQMSLIYLATVHDKLTGTTWNNGTAVSYSLRQYDLTNFDPPHWFVMNDLLMNLFTWGALAIEIALGVLVWNRKARPWVLAAGVILHLTILLSLAVAFFTFAMFVLYVAFIPTDTSQRWFADEDARRRTFRRGKPGSRRADARRPTRSAGPGKRRKADKAVAPADAS